MTIRVPFPGAESIAREPPAMETDRKSTRLNSSHSQISYAVFCLKKKNKRPNSTLSQIPNPVFSIKRQRQSMRQLPNRTSRSAAPIDHNEAPFHTYQLQSHRHDMQ